MISKYKDHPSVVAFQNENIRSNFSLRQVEHLKVMNAVMCLAKNKSVSGDIPISIIQNCVNFYLNFFTDCINTLASSSFFF